MPSTFNRRAFLGLGALSALGLSSVGRAALAQNARQTRPKNVLFIAVDDLRPALGCYGDRLAITPNIDALAARGTLFERAYCQQAVCAPSRNSLLTGLRPDTIGIYDLQTFFRKHVPNAVTLPQHFKANGYQTARVGKIFHNSHGNKDDKLSWSSMAPRPGAISPSIAPATQSEEGASVPPAKPAPDPAPKPVLAPYGAPEVGDETLGDGKIAAGAIEWLQHFKTQAAPFFLAVGFLKPHLPFVAPKKYWDMHDASKFQASSDTAPPLGAPSYALHGPGELSSYAGMPKGKTPVPDDEARRLIHGYYAATSYMDAQLGRVLAELDRLGLRENTLIVLWGDHGFQLGENGEWAKHNNLELSTRAPLIMAAPGFPGGQKTTALTEFVDIFPSLCDLAGLPLPQQQPVPLEGVSFVALMKNPRRAWKSAAFSLWPRGGNRNDEIPKGMGRAMRTDRYRFVEWTHNDQTPTGYELYDYQTDPQEDVNLAAKLENAALVEQMKAKLHAGWKAALPPR